MLLFVVIVFFLPLNHLTTTAYILVHIYEPRAKKRAKDKTVGKVKRTTELIDLFL